MLGDLEVLRVENDKFLVANNLFNTELQNVEPAVQSTVTLLLDTQTQEMAAGVKKTIKEMAERLQSSIEHVDTLLAQSAKLLG